MNFVNSSVFGEGVGVVECIALGKGVKGGGGGGDVV